MVGAVPKGIGQQEAVASRGQVKYSLSNDKANPKENVTRWQKGDNQKHQCQSQGPDMKRKRLEYAKCYICMHTHLKINCDIVLSSRYFHNQCSTKEGNTFNVQLQ